MEELEKTLLTVDFKGLERYLNKADNKTYIVNFWATWCKPCVEELPYFEQAGKKYRDQNVEVLLVSLDFPNQVEKQLKPFIEKNKLSCINGFLIIGTIPSFNAHSCFNYKDIYGPV